MGITIAMTEFSDARPYLRNAGVASRVEEILVANCVGRAVLVAEMIEQVGARRLGSLLNANSAALSEIAITIRKDLGSTSQIADASRYLPPKVWEAHCSAEGSFHDRVVRSRPKGWSWTELAAAGAPMSAACVAGIARDVFEESRQLSALSGTRPWTAAADGPVVHRFTFAQRCAISGSPFLAPRLEADEDRKYSAPGFTEAPSKRLRQAGEFGREGQDPRQSGWRFQGHLELELQVRMSIRSFAKSWRSYCSGWHAWHHFMAAYHPADRHFPITLPRLAGFASHFRNEASLSTYIAWIRSGQTLLGIEDGFGKRVGDSLLRGLRASWVPLPKAIIRLEAVERLVLKAIRSGLVQYARASAVCYHFTLRAQSEAFGLTLDGARNGPRGWHSRVTFTSKGAILHLESRKNVRGESHVERRCCCQSSRAACGPCALRGAASDLLAKSGTRQAAGQQRLLDLGSASKARAILGQLAEAVGIEKASWHGFRRGSATDLVAKGASLAQVLSSGAWKSAAFLKYISAQALGRRQALDFSFNESDSDREGS